ncbi:hypothetical protein C8J57DRAFT_1237390 [Mycena rebaudengoi]|nr:hypothetical protein C8J57DRAFT_1237390 [Mycena rebaudengoi]
MERLAASQLRKARVDELMRRRRATTSLHTILFSDGYIWLGAETTQRIAAAAVTRVTAKLAAEELAARKARVARLERLRTEGLKKKVFGIDMVQAKRTTLLQLFHLSRLIKRTVRHHLYQHIAVGLNSNAQLLIRTLAADDSLPPMVRSLEFLPINSPGRLEGPEWEQVLSQMSNLLNLGVSEHVELTNTGLQGISFGLTRFSAFDHLTERWGVFLQSQPTIVHLELHLTLAGPAPVLPALKTLIARPEPAAQVLEKNSVDELILSRPDTDLRGISDDALKTFTRGQPGVDTLRLGCGELVALIEYPNLRTLRAALSRLTAQTTPYLRTIRLVAWDRQPRVKLIFAAVSAGPRLKTLTNIHYCNEMRGCHNWSHSNDMRGDGVGCDFHKDQTHVRIGWRAPDSRKPEGDAVITAALHHSRILIHPKPARARTLSVACRSHSNSMERETPLDIIGEIASYVSRPTLLQLFYVSRQIGPTHRRLLRTLAANAQLPPLFTNPAIVQIHSLELSRTEYCGRLWGPEWDRVLAEMSNVSILGIADHVHLSDNALQHITFQLKLFASSDPIDGAWSLFLHNQPTIEHLELHSTLAGPAPVLPMLRTAIVTPSIAARLLQVNTIEDLTFYPPFPQSCVRGIIPSDMQLFTTAQPGVVKLRLRCRQFMYLAKAPNMFVHLQHLVLDDDRSWRHDPELSKLRSVARKLDCHLVPVLSTLRMVSSDSRPTASKVWRAVYERGHLPTLHNMHYCRTRGCENWVRSKEEMGILAIDCDYFEGNFLGGNIEESSDYWPSEPESDSEEEI